MSDQNQTEFQYYLRLVGLDEHILPFSISPRVCFCIKCYIVSDIFSCFEKYAWNKVARISKGNNKSIYTHINQN